MHEVRCIGMHLATERGWQTLKKNGEISSNYALGSKAKLLGSYRGEECEGGRILWGGMRGFFGLDYAVRWCVAMRRCGRFGG
jgi:hypothetical protein